MVFWLKRESGGWDLGRDLVSREKEKKHEGSSKSYIKRVYMFFPLVTSKLSRERRFNPKVRRIDTPRTSPCYLKTILILMLNFSKLSPCKFGYLVVLCFENWDYLLSVVRGLELYWQFCIICVIIRHCAVSHSSKMLVIYFFPPFDFTMKSFSVIVLMSSFLSDLLDTC